ncbi:hypothetical protein FOZ61_005566 [Perkinsus olseni]|uniref:Uncharacterized protein n=1 Tax=Perkinsus olseni TaxID=32597 RepID=A0A7J6LUM6_PEROL|nr:hypothetical protein FOZ61_005566 [Perkinsus olseni]KAF4662999.1 hypothetical protein FOL46_005044 [Perkinsus olseni]
MTPAAGLYFNEQTSEQLATVSLKVFDGVQQTPEASLVLFCTTARCSQSTLGIDKPRYFNRMSPKMAYGLAFTPPTLSLARIDELCFLLSTTGRDDEMEIFEAFTLAGDTFDISNFITATTVLCWSQDSGAWNLRLGMNMDEQGGVSPDCVVQLQWIETTP